MDDKQTMHAHMNHKQANYEPTLESQTNKLCTHTLMTNKQTMQAHIDERETNSASTHG